jgi:hypothetical protein
MAEEERERKIKEIDIEELNNIIQDIKDDINSGSRIIDCPDRPFGHVLIDIPMRGIKFKFYDMLPYIEQASDRLEDIDINMVNITLRFVDEESTKITSSEFYDIMNDGYSRKKDSEFFSLVSASKNLKNLVRVINQDDNLSNVLIKYKYKYDDSVEEKPKSWIKKFKSYFESNI